MRARASSLLRVLVTAAACAAPFAGCGDDPPNFESPDEEVCLDRRDGERYCIERYEASRRDASETAAGTDDQGAPRSLKGRLPWTQVTWAAARAACESKGKRLCELDEWVDACDGAIGTEGLRYTYGDVIDAARCNVGGQGVRPSGSFDGCVSPTRVLDQSGNVWEWTGNTAAAAAARGGGYRSSQAHRCADVLSNIPVTESTPEIGFRCCRSQ